MRRMRTTPIEIAQDARLAADGESVGALLKSMSAGDTAEVSWRIAGTNEPPVSKRLTVQRKTSRSITLVDGSGGFTRGWTVKFSDIGNEAPFSNQLVSVTQTPAPEAP